jgi:hypothetical protein
MTDTLLIILIVAMYASNKPGLSEPIGETIKSYALILALLSPIALLGFILFG